MRARHLRAKQAAKLLLGLIPLLKRSDTLSEPTTLLVDMGVSYALKMIIEQDDIGLLATIHPETAAQISNRITSFAISSHNAPNRIIETLPGDADERAMLYASMRAIMHQAPFRYSRGLARSRKSP